ncbi:MAG: magnesium chelatase, partial [Phototrophicales bacterium]
IMDRIDLWVTVEHVDFEQLSSKEPNKKPTSPSMRKAVEDARRKARQRQEELKLSAHQNALLSARDLENINIDDDARGVLNTSARALALSPRAYHRTIKVAQTIADLENQQQISQNHILEALAYRRRDI